MIYRSNLIAPDLTPHFKLLSPAVQIFGHDVPTDPDYDPGCGFWTHDEAAILYNVAKQRPGVWLDLGSRMGWTSAHILAAGCSVHMVDQAYHNEAIKKRAVDSTIQVIEEDFSSWPMASSVENFFAGYAHLYQYDGFVIDADHDRPQPTLDAMRCHQSAQEDSVILMHDFMGRPIQDAVVVLMALGWRCRIYDTPNGVALLWRDAKFVPPTHRPDPSINWRKMRDDIREQEQFPYHRTE